MSNSHITIDQFEERKVAFAINGLACYMVDDEDNIHQMVLAAHKSDDGNFQVTVGDAMGYLKQDTITCPGDTQLLVTESQLWFTPIYDVCYVDGQPVGNVLITDVSTRRGTEPLQLHVIATPKDGEVVITIETLDKLVVKAEDFNTFATMFSIVRGYAKAWRQATR